MTRQLESQNAIAVALTEEDGLPISIATQIAKEVWERWGGLGSVYWHDGYCRALGCCSGWHDPCIFAAQREAP